MTNESDNTNIQDRYAARFAADLESNTQEQKDIRSQMASLQDRLGQLEAEYAWLSGMQGTLGAEPGASEEGEAAAAEGPAKSSTADVGVDTTATQEAAPKAVPRPRRAKKAASTAGRSRKVAKSAKAAQAKPADEPKARKAGGAKKSGEPTLRELVLSLLAQHREPRMAAEVVKELTEKHPERNAATQVVRNTLEALVAKGDVERERKQGSVFYTAPTTGAAPEATPEEAGAEAAAKV
ncbi:hypothetical protein AB0M39_29435 [Streptomyces sp. NPDC051907]|uniref:hypothetical protein n=1 Tax=Streptomyces sp. NPDC051907 TaxID=3155284 RepID=UPI0034442E14